MKRVILLFFILFHRPLLAFEYPRYDVSFLTSLPATVFYNETLHLPVLLNYSYGSVRGRKQWVIPAGTYLSAVSGACPLVPYDEGSYWRNTCTLSLAVPGDVLGKVITGSLSYRVTGSEGRWPKEKNWDFFVSSASFYIKVIPHHLSMSVIPTQEGTANQGFIYNLRQAVTYYDENVRAGQAALGIVHPIEQDGLFFDQTTFSLVGKPTRTGFYHFKVGAQNAYGATALTDLNVHVRINPKDKPVFKKNYAMPGAMPGKRYQMNLLELIEPMSGLMITNQIAFKLDAHQTHPDWLHVAPTEATLLEGEVPYSAAGQDMVLTLIASSNTGGDSEPLRVKIPVAYDPDKKPLVHYFQLIESVGTRIEEDVSRHITDPSNDASLQVVLDNVVPAAPWLHVSSQNPVVLEGVVPDTATGETFQISWHANTAMGGHSELMTIPLQIRVNPTLTPRFKSVNPMLPMIEPGQPFFYDFVENRDVFPEYEEAPYHIDFAEGHEHPQWLKIVSNRLIAEVVPSVVPQGITLYLRVKNKPGGYSDVIQLVLASKK